MAVDPRTRKIFFWTLFGISVLAVVAAVSDLFFNPDAAVPVLEGALVVLILALGAEIVLVLLERDRTFEEEMNAEMQAEPSAGPAAPAMVGASAAASAMPASRELLLRCTTCGNVFAVEDTGERPLRHACPHCGRVGVLRSPPAEAPPASGGTASP
jgi:predicted RNA-binding Zn-ribbon protein involved in translation (DUF1610 family)